MDSSEYRIWAVAARHLVAAGYSPETAIVLATQAKMTAEVMQEDAVLAVFHLLKDMKALPKAKQVIPYGN